jgi:hypothetical protein
LQVHIPQRVDQAHEAQPLPEEDRHSGRGDHHQEKIQVTSKHFSLNNPFSTDSGSILVVFVLFCCFFPNFNKKIVNFIKPKVQRHFSKKQQYKIGILVVNTFANNIINFRQNFPQIIKLTWLAKFQNHLDQVEACGGTRSGRLAEGPPRQPRPRSLPGPRPTPGRLEAAGGSAPTRRSDTLCLLSQQGCQMVCFHTKNTSFGKIWRALEWKMLLNFTTV